MKAMPQLATITRRSGLSPNFRCPYQAKVMKIFEIASNAIGSTWYMAMDDPDNRRLECAAEAPARPNRHDRGRRFIQSSGSLHLLPCACAALSGRPSQAFSCAQSCGKDAGFGVLGILMQALLLRLILVLVFALSVPAYAQDEGGSLLDPLSRLLRGGGETGVEAPEGPQRRVPFSREEIQLSFAPLVEQTAPAVVNVYASAMVEARSPFMGDPFFERFFNFPQMPPRQRSSLGSG